MLTVYFEDHGQDFLEWDIKDGKVVACRPFQAGVWVGTVVHNKRIAKNTRLIIDTPSGSGTAVALKYRVERVKNIKGTA